MSETTQAPLFRAEGLSVRYGGITANNGITLEVGIGEIVGLIGPNGAGKTTFVDAVTGFTSSTGTVSLEGARISGRGPHRLRRDGVARTWQAGELFADLTIAENLAVAVQRPGLRTLITDIINGTKPSAKTIARALTMVGLMEHAHRLPSELTLGQQKLVGVARAIVGDTRMLLLDEPAAGLDTHESRDFGLELRRIAGTGIGVLLIDHDMSLVLEVCDRIYVLDFGTVIAEGRPSDVVADQKVVAAYLGSAEQPEPPAPSDHILGSTSQKEATT